MLSKKTGLAIAKAILNHVTTNSFTYIQMIGALLTQDYITASILAKKLVFKTAFAFLLKRLKALKDKPHDSKRK